MKASTGFNMSAAVTMTKSLKYRCPPGTGILNEDKTIVIASNIAIKVNLFTEIFIKTSKYVYILNSFWLSAYTQKCYNLYDQIGMRYEQ